MLIDTIDMSLFKELELTRRPRISAWGEPHPSHTPRLYSFTFLETKLKLNSMDTLAELKRSLRREDNILITVDINYFYETCGTDTASGPGVSYRSVMDAAY